MGKEQIINGCAGRRREENRMKRRALLAVLSAGVLAAALAGCGSSGSGEGAAASAEVAETAETAEEEADAASPAAEATETDDAEGQLGAVQSAGKMVVGMEGDWAPWSYHDTDSNEVIGFDADTARAIGEKLGVEVEIVEAPWESLFAGLDDGRYDMVVNGVEITEERSEKYDFSEPYGYIHTALVVRGDNEDIHSFEDLSGKKTVNSIGSTYMELAESYGASAAGVSTLNDTIQNVLDGRADATLNADVSIYDYMNQQPDADIKIAAVTEEASQVAIPMRKGDESASFREAVNEAVRELKEDGTLAKLSEQYFGSDITKE